VTGSGAAAIGGGVIAAVSATIGLMTVSHPHLWAVIVLALLIVVGLALIAWGATRREVVNQRGSAFIRGQVDDSSFEDSSSEAETFVEGDVRRSWFRRVEHRPRKR
jgi:hypothetical protein